MKYILNEDYENGNFDNIIEAENTKELVEKLGDIKGIGIDVCPDERFDGVVFVNR